MGIDCRMTPILKWSSLSVSLTDHMTRTQRRPLTKSKFRFSLMVIIWLIRIRPSKNHAHYSIQPNLTQPQNLPANSGFVPMMTQRFPICNKYQVLACQPIIGISSKNNKRSDRCYHISLGFTTPLKSNKDVYWQQRYSSTSGCRNKCWSR